MGEHEYLRSRLRRGRWFHYFRFKEKEISLGVHGLPPNDPRVMAAYWVEYARQMDSPPDAIAPTTDTFGWAVEVYSTSSHWKNELRETTRKNRRAIYKRYINAQGDRPLSTITADDIEAALYAKGGFSAVNELKALRPIFKYLKALRLIQRDPTADVDIKKPESMGFTTASADDIQTFQERWPTGNVERLIFDLALYTGAARVDLAQLSRKNIKNGLLTFYRQKTGVLAEVPITRELSSVIAHTPDIAPTFILSKWGKPYTAETIGNMFRKAALEAGIDTRLHGLRKAFCVYWAEQGATTHQIAAMAGHSSLSEVERYTRAADRTRIVKLLTKGR